MGYQLDPWQHIVAINFGKILPADYAICYARLYPAHSALVGYAGITNPNLGSIEGNVEVNSVGNWPAPIIPFGSGNRSFPEAGNGSEDTEAPLPTKLPTLEEMQAVYTWHVGRSHAWGLSDQIIVNVKKLQEDYPDQGGFTISMASHTEDPREGGDGDYLPDPDNYDRDNKKDLRLIVGLRAYAGDGGTFQMGGEDVFDPFGNLVLETDIVHYAGGEIEMVANFEQFAAVAPITVYGGAIVTLRAITWEISVKRPKSSLLTGAPITTQEA